MKHNPKILAFLKNSQQSNGSFLEYISNDKDNFQKARGLHSIIVTAQVLLFLNDVEENKLLKTIKDKAANFLLKQKNDDWSFNFHTSKNLQNHNQHTLNATFLCLSALIKHRPSILNGEMIAEVLKTLTKAEATEGGPYYTYQAKNSQKEIDFATNFYIARFLKNIDVTLPKLDKFIIKEIKKNTTSSNFNFFPISNDYYLNNYPKIQRTKSLNLGNFELGAIETFFKYKNHKSKQIFYIGSKTIKHARHLYTTAPETINFKNIKKLDINQEKTYHQIISKINSHFELFNQELRKQAKRCLNKILKLDTEKEITMLSYHFQNSFQAKQRIINNKTLIDLGIANTYICLASTIYNNFLTKRETPQELSVANFCLREFTSIYKKFTYLDSNIEKIFNEIMNNSDSAIAWELAHCRAKIYKNSIIIPKTIPDYQDYKKLAEKNLAHALGPITLMILNNNGTKDIGNLLKFFKHYLIARQLNNDAHNWEKDFKMGHINSVSALLLNINKQKKYNFTSDLKQLQNTYWLKVLPKVSEIILQNVKLAKKQLELISIIKDKRGLEKLTDKYQTAAVNAIEEQKKAIAFIKAYSK